MATYVKESGSWKEVIKLMTKAGGTWKEVELAYVKQNGTWETVYNTDFHWIAGAWSACSAPCDWGTQTRQVWCESVNRPGIVVADERCVKYATTPKPTDTQSCFITSCWESQFVYTGNLNDITWVWEIGKIQPAVWRVQSFWGQFYLPIGSEAGQPNPFLGLDRRDFNNEIAALGFTQISVGGRTYRRGGLVATDNISFWRYAIERYYY